MLEDYLLVVKSFRLVMNGFLAPDNLNLKPVLLNPNPQFLHFRPVLGGSRYSTFCTSSDVLVR